jgi:hypothetical protein
MEVIVDPKTVLTVSVILIIAGDIVLNMLIMFRLTKETVVNDDAVVGTIYIIAKIVRLIGKVIFIMLLLSEFDTIRNATMCIFGGK